MSAVPAAVASSSDANQGSQAIRQQNHANNVARLRAALQLRRQARLAGTGNTPAQEARTVNDRRTDIASRPAAGVAIRTTFRTSGGSGRHVSFANISLAAQAKRVALISSINQSWEMCSENWPTEIRPVRHVAVKRIVALQPKDMSTNMLEGLCKLSSMTRAHATDAQKLMSAVAKARSTSTGVPSNLQIKDVVSAIQKVQEYGVLKRATAAQQQGEQTGTTSTATVETDPATRTSQQPAAATAATTMSLTASTNASWAEQAVSVRHLYLMMQRRAVAAQKQHVTVTVTL
ncbi:hypothetical protein LTR86_006578 [Recurvomyces mirabilis]|nr:hypothetical protein LTR86_006578 [Recurvomyces mirabilis]